MRIAAGARLNGRAARAAVTHAPESGEISGAVIAERSKFRRNDGRAAFSRCCGMGILRPPLSSWRLENAIVCYVAYIGKTVWPAKLAVFYPHPLHSLSWSDVTLSGNHLVM